MQHNSSLINHSEPLLNCRSYGPVKESCTHHRYSRKTQTNLCVDDLVRISSSLEKVHGVVSNDVIVQKCLCKYRPHLESDYGCLRYTLFTFYGSFRYFSSSSCVTFFHIQPQIRSISYILGRSQCVRCLIRLPST